MSPEKISSLGKHGFYCCPFFQPPPVELKPCDVKSMLKCPPPLECPSFEGVNVGRGKGIPTVCVGDIYREGNLVTTVGLKVWHINEYRHFELSPAHHGHFHSGNSRRQT